MDDPPRTDCSPEDWENTFRYEFVAAMLYTPDLRRVRSNGASIAVARGVKSEDACYATGAVPQSDIMDCPLLIFPGHHTAFEDQS